MFAITYFKLNHIPSAQLGQTHSIIDLHLDNEHLLSVTGLSPTTIYRLSSNDSSPCDDEECSHRHKFRNYHEEACSLRTVCIRLGANPCGDVWIKFGTNKNKTEVCRTREMFKANISSEVNLDFSVEYRPRTSLEVDCYMWCTPSGDLPSPRSHNDVEKSLLDELMTETEVVSEVDHDHVEVMSLSPVIVNKVMLLPHDCEDGEKCSHEVTLKINMPLVDKMILGLTCTELGPNACGDHGVALVKGQKVVDVCSNGRLYQEGIDGVAGPLLLTHWYTSHTSATPTCYVWLTEDGGLPRPNKDNVVSEETMEQLVSWHRDVS